MRKKEWFVLIACIFCIACSALFSFGEECSFIRENTLRLHILANSDSPADQALKLKIRDAVLSCSGELFSGCDTRQKMISAAQEQLPKIQQVAEQTALHNGYELPVTVSVTDMFFETRRYDHVIRPAGTYTAVRIELGAAAGKNWWCVLYPNLCFLDTTNAVVPDKGKKQLKQVLTEEEYSKVTANTKFKIGWYFWK